MRLIYWYHTGIWRIIDSFRSGIGISICIHIRVRIYIRMHTNMCSGVGIRFAIANDT